MKVTEIFPAATTASHTGFRARLQLTDLANVSQHGSRPLQQIAASVVLPLVGKSGRGQKPRLCWLYEPEKIEAQTEPLFLLQT
jgi:hypothetical protein